MLLRPLAEYYGFKMNSRSISKRKDADEIIFRQCDRHKGSKFIVVISVLVPLCVVLTCLALFMGHVINQDICYTLPLISNAHFEELEVFCDDLSLSPDEDFETFDSGSKNRLSVSVIKRNLRRHYAKGKEQIPYMSCGNRSLAPKSGYNTMTLTTISKTEKINDDDKEVVLHWEHENKTGNSSDDLVRMYNNAEITVQTGQTYVIYASVNVNISLQKEHDHVQKDRRRFFTLKVCKRIHGYEQILLGETKQFDRDCESDIVSTVRVMGHILLRKNDVIYTKVSRADDVMHMSRGNTFGMFPLSSS